MSWRLPLTRPDASYFFSIEGIDGSGKTTQCRSVKERLLALDLPVIQTRDPGGTAAGEAIRNLLLFEKADLSITAQVLLFFAARDQALNEVIRPSLLDGKIVMTDRHTLSTLAYQGYGLAKGDEGTLEMISTLDRTMPVRPDITFWLDVPVSISSQRTEARNAGSDRLESNGADFFERVRTGYSEAWKKNPERIIRIDGTKEQSLITLEIMSILKQSMAEKAILSA
ncbi:hypothetical protein AD930_07560 [Acetobacter malorum]|nr:hypothetical protein AD930_07560 [Acetobacter malorum]